MKIVKTNVSYSYNMMIKDTFKLKKIYNFIEIGYIGRSVLNKMIPYIRIGNGKNKVCYSGSIHANEWITSVLLMKFVENVCNAYTKVESINGFDINNIFKNSSIYIIPMVNPDGVDIVVNNKFNIDIINIAKEYSNIPFPNGWKSNARGVDLNGQFPANWELGNIIKCSKDYYKPSPRGFCGYKSLTEPESIALYKFTRKHKFDLILSYHTQGRVIYWKYMKYNVEKQEKIANFFAKKSGYKLENVPDEQSHGGYRDWFIQEYNKPGFTIEVGKGKSPIHISQFHNIFYENIDILLSATNINNLI